MNWTSQHLWLIPALPLFAAAILSVTKRAHRQFAAALAIGAMAISCVFAISAFITTLAKTSNGGPWLEVHNFDWFQIAESTVRLGWVLDPLSGIMLAMVTFVSLLIFIYSSGYMANDENFTRFFCFLSLFAAAMLGLIISNNLLLLFMCWELVGLASYLLIGFWFHKPNAAAAAKKAFITTRIGDVIFFLGVLYLYSQAQTLLFYDGGHGCLEKGVLSELVGRATVGGMAVTTAIGLLIFAGAVGKSGQVPLHVWLPDAMEGPTPVSALIHAATMVAAGVFLIARVYPLLDPNTVGVSGSNAALTVVAWIGAVTALFAASIAVAQTDIKRILAYSTVSQLGFMMLGLATGGVAVGMFHLLTHAFFKALLFLGAGSVIHGCDDEQNIRKMGGLGRYMPVTFATYAVGMMALSGVPIFFSGFWSKDEILHAARQWPHSPLPFYSAVCAAVLTAFYMARQMFFVFAGKNRGHDEPSADHGRKHHAPHESPPVMTVPLVILAVFAFGFGFVGTPALPWIQQYLGGERVTFSFELFLISTAIVTVGFGAGWWFYGRVPIETSAQADPLEEVQPDIFSLLRNKFFVDEFYEFTVIRFNAWWCDFCDFLDYWVWQGAVFTVSYAIVGLSWVSRVLDEYVLNLGFNQSCRGVADGGKWLSRLESGRVQSYLRVIGVALAALGLILLWGCSSI